MLFSKVVYAMFGSTCHHHQNTCSNTGNGTASYYCCGDAPTSPPLTIPSTDQSVVTDVGDVHFKGPRGSVSTSSFAATSVLDENDNFDMRLNPPSAVRIHGTNDEVTQIIDNTSIEYKKAFTLLQVADKEVIRQICQKKPHQHSQKFKKISVNSLMLL